MAFGCGREVDVDTFVAARTDILMEDYTKLPIGTQVGLHQVKMCPHCGRRGLEVVSNGATSYKHGTGGGYTTEGVIVAAWDSCPADAPPLRTGPPDEVLD